MLDSSVIDPQAIENLRELNLDDGDAFLREITGIFLDDTPQRIAELEQSLVSGDNATFIRAAHSIKGSSANLGALILRAAAEKLEHESKVNGLGSVGPLLEAVKTEFGRAQVALSVLVAT
jgi:HPt (histidine-containing phosphotransfer) domain-containing protein